MANLIARLQALVASDATITAALAQQLLDDRAVLVAQPLRPRVPFYLDFVCDYENLEEGSVTKIWVGYNQLLTEGTEYTVDYQRGIVTRAAADYRGLRIMTIAYDLWGAAADAFDLIATGDLGGGDSVAGLGYTFTGGTFSDASKLAARYRTRAWPRTERAERIDTAIDPRWRDDWHQRRHARAGYTP
ncbi:MAG TPA: hypothetical protein PKK15_17870 [Kouleothrix sp.]|nr:hypothetical protein [Kouleothrix sp.]